MYPGGNLWFTPDDGGEPYEVHVGNIVEALARDPAHYSRTKPEPKAKRATSAQRFSRHRNETGGGD